MFKNKSPSYNLHGLAHIGTLYIPKKREDARTGGSAAAAGEEQSGKTCFFSTDARYSKSNEALHLKQRLMQRDGHGIKMFFEYLTPVTTPVVSLLSVTG